MTLKSLSPGSSPESQITTWNGHLPADDAQSVRPHNFQGLHQSFPPRPYPVPTTPADRYPVIYSHIILCAHNLLSLIIVVMSNIIFQLDWAKWVPRSLVKHDSGCFCESVLG